MDGLSPRAFLFCHPERQRGVTQWMPRFAQHDRVILFDFFVFTMFQNLTFAKQIFKNDKNEK
jgi:hypothetical protein